MRTRATRKKIGSVKGFLRSSRILLFADRAWNFALVRTRCVRESVNPHDADRVEAQGSGLLPPSIRAGGSGSGSTAADGCPFVTQGISLGVQFFEGSEPYDLYKATSHSVICGQRAPFCRKSTSSGFRACAQQPAGVNCPSLWKAKAGSAVSYHNFRFPPPQNSLCSAKDMIERKFQSAPAYL